MGILRRIDMMVPVLALLIVLVLPWHSWSQERVGTVLAIEGTAEVQEQGATGWERLKFRDAIFLNDTVQTAAASKVKVLLRDESIMTLAEESVMEFRAVAPEEQPGRTVVGLTVGTLRVLTSRLLGPNDVREVHTPNTVAGVRGTIFLVRFIPPDTTEVVSFDDLISVRHLDPAIPQIEPVAPGQRSSVIGLNPPTPAVPVPPGELRELNQAVDLRAQVPSQILPTGQRQAAVVPRGETLAPGVPAGPLPPRPAAAPSLPAAVPTRVAEGRPSLGEMIEDPPYTVDTSPAGMEMLMEQNNSQVQIIITIPR